MKSTKPDTPILRPTAGRSPPHHLDAEAAVLSTLLLKPDEYDVVAGTLKSEHFYSDANRRIYEAIAALREANLVVDTITVASWLRDHERLGQVGGTPYIAQILGEIPATANVLAYAEIVRDKWLKRTFIAKCQVFAAEAYATETEGRELVQVAEAALAELGSSGVDAKFARLGDLVDGEVQRLYEAHKQGITFTGFDTGFHRLNEMTAGLHDGDLVVIAGRPGLGKTSFATNLAVNIARGRRDASPVGAAFFSLEMPKEQLAIRIACAERSIDSAAARKNRLTAAQWAEMTQAALDLSKLPLWIDDTAALTLLELRARVRKLQRDIEAGRTDVPCSRLAFVGIDYLQLMQGVRGYGDSRENEVSGLSRGLKQLAKDLKVPVVCLSQLNRSVEKRGGNKRPQLSDLRESGAIEQDADAVWFLYRDDYYDKQAAKGEAELIIEKQRNGACGTVELQFQGASMRFFERAAPGDYNDRDDDFDSELGRV